MPTHDIIDNRNERLVDHINRILPSAERAKFAVGYFFLSGFEPIQKNRAEVKRPSGIDTRGAWNSGKRYERS